MLFKHCDLVLQAVVNCFLGQYLTVSLRGILILIVIISSVSIFLVCFSFILFIHLTCKLFGCNWSDIMGN